jgi:hypothetical protein
MNLHPLLIDRGLRRVGSDADIVGYQRDVRFPPKADITQDQLDVSPEPFQCTQTALCSCINLMARELVQRAPTR